MSRESVYDAEIFPLMAKVIEICKKNGIPCLCDFALDGDLKCTTAILGDELNPPAEMIQAYRLLAPRQSSGLKITTRNADGKIVSQEVVIG